MGQKLAKRLRPTAGILAGLLIIAPAMAQPPVKHDPHAKPVAKASPQNDRSKLSAFQSSLAAAAAKLSAADKTYVVGVRAALKGGALGQADTALTRYEQDVTLAVRAAPSTPAFSSCSAAAKPGAEKALGVLVEAGAGRRQRVQHLRQLSAARPLSIADYFSVAPPGAVDPAAGSKRGLTEASDAITRCEISLRPKPPPKRVKKHSKARSHTPSAYDEP